jgi:hypothetical protein
MSYGDAETLFSKVGSQLSQRPRIFQGTIAEYEALTSEEQAKYDYIAVPSEALYEIEKDSSGTPTGNYTLIANTEGVPSGGAAGDILVKNSATDFDSGWKGQDDVLDIVIPQNAGAHNGIYRGKYLGSSVSADQYAEISAGTFKGMYIGDYWTIGGVNYRIASFNYWLRTGDTECTKNHIVLVPDTNLYSAVMNDTNVVTGAYVGSKMYTTNLATAKSTINSAFGSAHVLNHREYLKNTVSGGYETAGAWYDSTVELMTEEMVYGGKEFKNAVQGTNFAAQYTISKSQLNLFTLDPSKICNRASWWLRDVAHSASFALVGIAGFCAGSGASHSLGVRPAFAICA